MEILDQTSHLPPDALAGKANGLASALVIMGYAQVRLLAGLARPLPPPPPLLHFRSALTQCCHRPHRTIPALASPLPVPPDASTTSMLYCLLPLTACRPPSTSLPWCNLPAIVARVFSCLVGVSTAQHTYAVSTLTK